MTFDEMNLTMARGVQTKMSACLHEYRTQSDCPLLLRTHRIGIVVAAFGSTLSSVFNSLRDM